MYMICKEKWLCKNLLLHGAIEAKDTLPSPTHLFFSVSAEVYTA